MTTPLTPIRSVQFRVDGQPNQALAADRHRYEKLAGSYLAMMIIAK